MKELIDQILAIGRGMWRYRWPGVVVAWVVAAVAAVAVFRIPDQYQASARVYVDTQSILKPLMSGLAVQPNVSQQMSMLTRTLISRPNVEKLVRMADLDLNAPTKEEKDALVEEMMKKLSIGGTGRDNLYTLSFRHEDQDKAKVVVQSLLSIFIESGLGASRQGTSSAKSFLDDQIRSHERQLEEAEARVLAFRLRNLETRGPDGKDVASRMSEFSQALDRARLELREAENARDAVRAQLEQERKRDASMQDTAARDSAAAPIAPPATPEIDARIAAQRRNLDTLLTRFTDQHPDVVIARRMIKELEEQKAKEVAEMRRTAAAARSDALASGGVTASPATQELGRVLASTEVQVASLRARVAEYSTRLAQAREAMKLAPQIESELAQLNRDQELLKKNYDSLIARRQQAEMSGQLELASGLADFRVIEPPRVSPKPVFPNRFALLSVALGAALAAGLFITFVISQLRPVMFSVSELRHKTGLPVLGVVSQVMGEADVKGMRMDLLRFTMASGGLVGLFVAGMAAMAVAAG